MMQPDPDAWFDPQATEFVDVDAPAAAEWSDRDSDEDPITQDPSSAPHHRRDRGLRLRPPDDPRRSSLKPLGMTKTERAEAVGLRVADARHHLHVQGVTGSGKSTWLAQHVLAEADAGRGVALLDCQGDLAQHVLNRLPAAAGDRLAILDPAETDAPPAWNVFDPPDQSTGEIGRARAAENVVAVFRNLYAAWWGPRMDDTLRAACLTLARRPGSTLADLVPILTRESVWRRAVAEHGEPDGYEGFWDAYGQFTTAQRSQVVGPVLSRLRSVLSRPFARDLLGGSQSTFNLSDVLDGGILIARLAKGEIGESTAQLVGSLLLSGLWAHTIQRSAQPPENRLDATIVVDECHNFLHLPIGVDDTLAEARGYRLSLVLAHQHQAQLPADVREAVDANARTKVFFTVSPNDAAKLVRHIEPRFEPRDLARRPAFEVVVRPVNHGSDAAPFTLTTVPLPPPVPGRAERLRQAARARVGLPADRRSAHHREARVAGDAPATGTLRQPRPDSGPADRGDRVSGRARVSRSLSPSESPRGSRLERDIDSDTPDPLYPQVGTDEEV